MIRFLGTLADWYKLKAKILYLDRYGCHKWLNVLLPVIQKFIDAIEKDEVDLEFWDKCYQFNPTKSETAKNKVWGWISNFFPYIGAERREQFASGGTMKKMFSERGNKWTSN